MIPPSEAIITSTMIIFLEFPDNAEDTEAIVDDAVSEIVDASTAILLLLYNNTLMFNMPNKRIKTI